MKKIYHLLALVILGAFTFTSCDDFLDMQPTNSGNAEGAVGTVADAQVVINGVMSAMTSSSYYGRNLFMYGDAKGGDLTMHSIRSTTLPTAILIPVSGAVDITAFCRSTPC